jgi:hypothetical protein
MTIAKLFVGCLERGMKALPIVGVELVFVIEALHEGSDHLDAFVGGELQCRIQDLLSIASHVVSRGAFSHKTRWPFQQPCPDPPLSQHRPDGRYDDEASYQAL